MKKEIEKVTEVEAKIIDEIVELTKPFPFIVDIDKISDQSVVDVLEDVNEEAILRTFEILGIATTHIETEINLYPRKELLKGLLLISQATLGLEREGAIKMAHKISVYLK